jgi:hypothetical protein
MIAGIEGSVWRWVLDWLLEALALKAIASLIKNLVMDLPLMASNMPISVWAILALAVVLVAGAWIARE